MLAWIRGEVRMKTEDKPLSRSQRAKQAKSIADEIRKRKAAIGELQNEHDKYKRDYNRRKDYDPKDNNARADRLNRIIAERGLRRVDIAARSGITPQHLSRLLRSKKARLGKRVENDIEKAIGDLTAEENQRLAEENKRLAKQIERSQKGGDQ